MTVELLYWEGCPSYDEALTELGQALAELGFGDVEVALRRIDTDAEAQAERFIGSPTVRVDGRDPIPPPEDEPAGLTCRIYRRADGRVSPTPDPQALRAGLRELLGVTRAT